MEHLMEKSHQYIALSIVIVVSLFVGQTFAKPWIPLNGIDAVPSNPTLQVLQSDYSRIQLHFQLLGFYAEPIERTEGKFTALSIPEEGYTALVGSPALPVIRRFLEIPYGATVSIQTGSPTSCDVKLADLDSSPILPLQAPIPKIEGALENTRFDVDQASYLKPGLSGNPLVRLGDPQILRGRRLVMVEISPIEYDPVERFLRVVTDVEISLHLTGSDVGLTRSKIQRYSTPYDNILADRLLINSDAYDETDLVSLPVGMLIITTPAISQTAILQQFVAWKQQKGFHTTVATTAQTGSLPIQIKSFILNAYNTWQVPPDFVLLIGDSDVIPPWEAQMPDIPGTDLYYSTLEGADLFPDIALGRISVRSERELINILSKTLNYEQVLWNGDQWEKAAVFMASNDCWQITEGTHESVIANYLQPDGYRSARLYCHTFSATPEEVSADVNVGCSLLIYAGHGYCFFWQDGPRFLQRDVEDLRNVYYPFVVSYACDTGQFMRLDECFGETWIRDRHGAIGFMGAACTSYWGADDILERKMFEGLFDEQLPREDQNLTWLAGMINYGKLSLWRYQGGSLMSSYYWELYNLLGDPSVDLWTDTPQVFTMTLPGFLHVGETTLSLNLSGISDWAMIHVYSDAESLQFSAYAENGPINLSLGSGFTQPGTLHIWVTGHDCHPRQETIPIVESSRDVEAASSIQSKPFVSASPNPFNPTTVIRFELPEAALVRLEMFDINGRNVSPSGIGTIPNQYGAGTHEIMIDASALPSGLYLYRLTAGIKTFSGKLVLMK
jgi:hypothetical protein